MFPKFREVS